MALTALEIEQRITALQNALGSGTLTVEYDGRRRTFRTQQELQNAIAFFRRELATIGGGANAPISADRGSFAAFSRD